MRERGDRKGAGHVRLDLDRIYYCSVSEGKSGTRERKFRKQKFTEAKEKFGVRSESDANVCVAGRNNKRSKVCFLYFLEFSFTFKSSLKIKY